MILILGHCSRIVQRHTTLNTPCHVIYLVAVLIGC